MVKCFVPLCNSGYKSCDTKYSLFKPPNDEAGLEAWRRAIPRKDRVLQKNDRVCERHFAPHFILRTWSAEVDGRVLMSGTRRAGLAKGAVPTIFEGAPKYLSKKVKSPRKPVRRQSRAVAPRCTVSKSRSSCEVESVRSGGADGAPTTDRAATSVVDGCGCEVENTVADPSKTPFEILFNSAPSMCLPGPSWAAHRIDVEGIKDVLFNDACIRHSGASSAVFTKKTLHVKRDMSVQPYVLGKPVECSTVGINSFATSVSEVDAMLTAVDNVSVCCGGPSLESFPTVLPECASVDCQGKWRHNKCPLVTTGGGICRPCSGLSDTLRIHAERQAMRIKQKRPLKHIRLPPLRRITLPAQHERLDALRFSRAALQRSRARLLKRNKLLMKQLEESKKEMMKIQDEDVAEKLQALDMPPAQLLLLKECISAAKCTAKTNRRYTDDWLLLCLLLNIRSPATYSFLRGNNILPLPCVSTIRKYISMVGLKCGFDEDFFKAFKVKVSKKTSFQKRGMLIFDEIHVRKEMTVCSQTMTYAGLVDNGEQGVQSNELADHGLVFAFSPFGESYLQPVAVFASKGPTKSTLLAQLLLQCIVYLERAGVFVDGIVCDGASTNRAMWKQLGISGALGNVANAFEHPLDVSRKVYVLSDVPHLFKCIRNRLYEKKILKRQGRFIKWSCYDALYVADTKHAADLRVCPKLTYSHVNPSNMLKMRVKLATQLFSNSVAKGIQFYARRGETRLCNAEATVEFTLFLNNLFDALNRRFPGEGLTLGCKDFLVIESASKWLDEWEQEVVNGDIPKDFFLTPSTAEGLRVTLKSVLELSRYLLTECNFKYVLTSKMNQDPLECFFGIIRQAGGQNEHPTFPTFLQLYRMLSLYSLLKPPQFGNCTAAESSQSAFVTLADIRGIYKSSAAERPKKLEELRNKLDGLISQGNWECEDVFDHDYCDANVVDCIIYYVTGFVSRKLANKTSCVVCKEALKGHRGFSKAAEAELVNCKTRGRLTHPNAHLFQLFRNIEEEFAKYADQRDVYNKTTDAVLAHFKFTFPCNFHKEDILAKLLHYYVCLRMRQYCKQLRAKNEKKSQDLRKLSKLV
ncbi:uncharacterized protein LOC144148165 [Haemaphysalis longicornis]